MGRSLKGLTLVLAPGRPVAAAAPRSSSWRQGAVLDLDRVAERARLLRDLRVGPTDHSHGSSSGSDRVSHGGRVDRRAVKGRPVGAGGTGHSALRPATARVRPSPLRRDRSTLRPSVKGAAQVAARPKPLTPVLHADLCTYGEPASGLVTGTVCDRRHGQQRSFPSNTRSPHTSHDR